MSTPDDIQRADAVRALADQKLNALQGAQLSLYRRRHQNQDALGFRTAVQVDIRRYNLLVLNLSESLGILENKWMLCRGVASECPELGWRTESVQRAIQDVVDYDRQLAHTAALLKPWGLSDALERLLEIKP